MAIPLSEIIGITGARAAGPQNVTINALQKIEEAAPGGLTFLGSPAYEKFLPTTRATAIFVKEGVAPSRSDITYLFVADPYKAFLQVLFRYFAPTFSFTGIDPTASVPESVSIGANVGIGKNVVIGERCVIGDNVTVYHNTVIGNDVTIGSGSLIYQNVSVREGCSIGNNNILHPGVVIGADGFGYAPGPGGAYIKIPQIGIVELEDDVEVGANSTIDRAALGKTVIKKGTKLDNLVQVAHNVSIGVNTVVSAQSGIAGSSKVGDNCIIAGQVGIAGHLEVADKVVIAAQTGVSKSLTEPGTYFGYPAKEHRTALRLEAHLRNLPDYAERIKALEKKIEALEAALKASDNRG